MLALVAYYDLTLHQMDVKTTFLNSELEKEDYIDQLEGFVSIGKRNMVCKSKKSIYGLNRLPDNGILSSMIPLCYMILKRTSFTGVST